MRAATRDRFCSVTTEQMITDRVSLETFCHRRPHWLASAPAPLAPSPHLIHSLLD